jgi:hypothetical protein
VASRGTAVLTDDDTAVLPETSLAEIGFVWFLRVVATYCLAFGILYWIRLIGFYDGLTWRFDLMPLHWQMTATTLAVMFPFAAIGLWLLTSWGAVLWFSCAVIEIIMYVWRADMFAYRPSVAISHCMIALLYLGFRVVLYRQDRIANGPH